MKKAISIITTVALTALAVSCGSSSPKIQIAAHRGYWNCEEAGFARNSVKALELAQKNGFWGSEFDVQMTSDSVLLVHHDNNVDTLIIWDNPHSAFQDCRLENGEPIPTFEDYLVQGEKSDKTVLVCELKQQKNEDLENVMTDKAIDALKAHNLYDPKRVMFISFSLNICKRVAQQCPEFTNQYLSDDLSPDQLHEMGINGIDFHYKVFKKHPEWYGQARSHKMSVNAWTVDDSTSIQKMIDLGVDCITTNEPIRVRGMLGKSEKTIK